MSWEYVASCEIQEDDPFTAKIIVKKLQTFAKLKEACKASIL